MLCLVRSWISSNKIKCWFLGSSVWVETCQGTVSPPRTLRVWHGFRSKPMPWTMSPVSITLFKKGFYPLKRILEERKCQMGGTEEIIFVGFDLLQNILRLEEWTPLTCPHQTVSGMFFFFHASSCWYSDVTDPLVTITACRAGKTSALL